MGFGREVGEYYTCRIDEDVDPLALKLLENLASWDSTFFSFVTSTL